MSMEDQLMHRTSSSSLIVYNGPLTNDAYLNLLPPGYRFHPSHEDLIVYYLKRKVNNEVLPPNRIHDANIYKCDPETLTARYKTHGEKECYFFTPRDRKHRNGRRPNRVIGDGYWKATGGDKAIKFNGAIVGFRKALVYHTGKPTKGQKTTWIMHEYTVSTAPPKSQRVGNNMRLDDWVLCRIYKKDEKSDGTSNQHQDDDIRTQNGFTVFPQSLVNQAMASTGFSHPNHTMIQLPVPSVIDPKLDQELAEVLPQSLSLPFQHNETMTSTGFSHPNHSMIQLPVPSVVDPKLDQELAEVLPQSLSLPFQHDETMTSTGFSHPNHSMIQLPVSSELQEGLQGVPKTPDQCASSHYDYDLQQYLLAHPGDSYEHWGFI